MQILQYMHIWGHRRRMFFTQMPRWHLTDLSRRTRRTRTRTRRRRIVFRCSSLRRRGNELRSDKNAKILSTGPRYQPDMKISAMRRRIDFRTNYL